uniref:Tyrosine-protein phosphatase non-receptor type n=1 Tax=Astyanax mexicanus TaxID=7994 RepID=A0A8B9GZ75_ASTMX
MEAEFREIDESGNWNAIYQEIRQQSSELPCRIAKLPENRSRNRYRDVSPFDHSRIPLQLGSNDYINASLISMEEAQRSYILTQVRYRMRLDLNSVLLHFPSNPSYFPWCSLCGFTREELGCTQETREILHFHYTTWPDFGVPESPASFLNFLFKVRESGCLNSEHGPVVVHCSAGIGRSGTFCLADTCLLLMSLRKDPSSVRIKDVLLDMRRYRMGLIQTADQLRFSYLAVIEGAKSIMGDTSVQESWKELSNEEDPPPEFTPPPRPRPPKDPHNGTGDPVKETTPRFFPENEMIHHASPETTHLTDHTEPTEPSEPPAKPARSPPPPETCSTLPEGGAAREWSPMLTSACVCTALVLGAYVGYRACFH